MKVSDLEDIVSVVSKEFFEYKNPGHSAVDNPKSVQNAIDDTAFIINKFINYFNKLAEEQLND
jgi:predicted methyltransferase